MESLKLKLHDLYRGSCSIAEFEAWVYEQSEELEQHLAESYFLELISFNYKSKYALQEFLKEFAEHMDIQAFEEMRMHAVLDSIIEKDEQLIENLLLTYKLRNHGYVFLERLGMEHALHIISVMDGEYSTWQAVSKEQLTELVEKDYLSIKEEALKVKAWLNEGKIVLTGRKDEELGYWVYQDKRGYGELSEGEKAYARYVARQERKQENRPPKRWWQFWKS